MILGRRFLAEEMKEQNFIILVVVILLSNLQGMYELTTSYRLYCIVTV